MKGIVLAGGSGTHDSLAEDAIAEEYKKRGLI